MHTGSWLGHGGEGRQPGAAGATRRARWRGPKQYALGVLFSGLALTCAVTYAFHRSVEERAATRFNGAVNRVTDRVEARIDMYVATMLAARGLFALHEDLTVDGFREFVEQLELQRRYPGIQGIGFSRRIRPDDVERVEAAMRRQGHEEFEVWPKDSDPELHAVVLLEPMDRRNRRAIGYDMSADPVRWEAMSRARDTGLPAASGRVTLVQEIEEDTQNGFLIYVPVYRDGRTPTSVEDRREALLGFVYSPFRADDFFAGAFRWERPWLTFDVYDAGGEEEELLHRSVAPGDDRARYEEQRTLDIAGRPWVLSLHSQPGLDDGSHRPLVPWIFVIGTLITLGLFAAAMTRRRALKELGLQALVFESMTEGVYVADEAGTILYTNPAVDTMFGYEPGELVGKHVTALNTYPPGENERVLEEVTTSLRTRGRWEGEFSNVRKDGTPFVTYARIVALVVSSSKYLVSVQEDITERKRAEREHDELLARERSARAEAEAANRAKDEFLAMLGHELRNPLSPIVTAVDLMRMRGDVSASRELQMIQRQVQHVVRLVDDLLDVSRITRGKILLEKHAVEISVVVSKAVEMASPMLEERRHRLDIEVPRSGLSVLADEARLAQVIANLLTNAAKFTPPGGHIVLWARLEGEEVVFGVRDEGAGIAPDLLPRIFDLFTQGKRALDRSQGGLGIGLTLVRSLVQMHDGTVEARSEGLGKGSEFIVRLPMSAPAEPKVASAVAQYAATEGPHRRLLVVDDNRDAAEMLAEILRAQGHEVAVAHDGPQALAVAERFEPEVSVLDIGLPVMDGYELAARLKELSPTRLIAVTGYGQEQDRKRAEEAGFERHFVKPVDTAALIQAIAADAA